MNGESNVGERRLSSGTHKLPAASVAAFGSGGMARRQKALMVRNQVTKLRLLDQASSKTPCI